MKHSKYLPIGVLMLALAGTGAMIATAQTAPMDGNTVIATADADAQVVRAHYRRDEERGNRSARKYEMRGGNHLKHAGRGRKMVRTVFGAVDADGDGVVTQTEVDAYRTAKLTEVDASGDGALSIDEFETLYRELTRARMVDMFQDIDADGDGAISTKELETRVSRMFERMDRDGDGALTLQRLSPRALPDAESEN